MNVPSAAWPSPADVANRVPAAAPGLLRALPARGEGDCIVFVSSAGLEQTDPQAFRFYRQALVVLRHSQVPFLVGGAYAFGYYTGIVRHTKDFDVFVRPADARPALAAFARAGYRTEVTFEHWLGKVFFENDFIDVIFSSGNGECAVDDDWFAHATAGEVLGVPARLCPAEEMVWQKAFIMERERFDGADVAHLLRARAAELDWERLLRRFGPHWRVLLSHLVLFGFVYPAEQDKIPAPVFDALVSRLRERGPAPAGLCRGTLLSREQYLADIENWGYQDARLRPVGRMTPEEVARWTAAAAR
jgi:hypothetical protein